MRVNVSFIRKKGIICQGEEGKWLFCFEIILLEFSHRFSSYRIPGEGFRERILI